MTPFFVVWDTQLMYCVTVGFKKLPQLGRIDLSILRTTQSPEGGLFKRCPCS